MTVDALLFDFDGLICDTESAALESWLQTYREFGLDLPDGLWAGMRGRHDGELLALEDLGERLGRAVTVRERERRRARKLEIANARPLLPGVAALLAEAASRGVGVAVVSSSPRTWVRPHLERLGVLGHFHAVVTGDLPLPRKPAPDLYLRALSELGVRAYTAVAFEDSEPGVRAALAADLRCVVVPRGAGAADQAAFAGRVAVVTSLETLTLEPPATLEHPALDSLERLFNHEFRTVAAD